MVRTKNELMTFLETHKEDLKSFGIRKLGVFGSFVRNEPRVDSDLDLLVDFEPGKLNYDNFIHLAYYVEDQVGRTVDLVTEDSLSPHLGPHILREVEYVTL